MQRSVMVDAELWELAREALDVARDVVKGSWHVSAQRRLRRFARLDALHAVNQRARDRRSTLRRVK